MSGNINNKQKQELCKKMASNLTTLRAKANLSQDELAERLGFSRQTISAIENRKRKMQWSTFTSIAMFFLKDQEIRELMFVLGIVNKDVEAIFQF